MSFGGGESVIHKLVAGVILRQGTEAIERAATGYMTMDLIASWDGTEVIRQQVKAGGRFGMRPEEGWGALECLYILSGEAVVEHDDQNLRLGPGDSLTGNPVQEPCILRALTDLTALYICSQPVFHQMSEELAAFTRLTVAVEEKDGYTVDHCRRIQHLSMAMGKRLGLSPARLDYLLLGAFLHDLGKVRVPEEILKKPSRLTAEEWQIMKQHTVFGRDMLLGTAAAGAAQILAQHHERLDGSGYPLGLSGEAISLEAQIVAVADSFDAMVTDRVYRPALSREAALAELREGIGRLYRADVVHAFMDSLVDDRSQAEVVL